jgi:hypothetical protein
MTSATRPPSATADADAKPTSAATTANPEMNPRRTMLCLIRLTSAVYSTLGDAATEMAARAIGLYGVQTSAATAGGSDRGERVGYPKPE